MKSLEGYTPQDAAGPGEGPWAGAPVDGPSLETSPGAGPQVRAAEDALEVALAEVSRVEDELRSMEQVRDRLRGQLEKASAEADALIAQVSDAYARERDRLEAELRSVQQRASGLEQIRETRLGKGEVPSLDLAPTPDVEAPEPQVFAVAPVPAAPEGETAPDEVALPVRAVVAAAEHQADAKRGDRKGRKRGDAAEADGEEAAYEDHWYQVLKRDNNLGAESS